MAALTNDRKTPRLGDDAIAEVDTLPVAASAKIYNGALVALNTSGYAVPASADPTLTVVGVAERQADNTGGANGAITVDIRRGPHGFVNGATTDALTIADVGQPCYALDDQTVTRTSAMGARPRVGRLVRLENGVPFVEVGVQSDPRVQDLYLLAGADLSALQYTFVKVNSSGAAIAASAAGEAVRGVLQNAPANGAVAIVRTNGPSRVVGSAAINPGVDVATTNTGTSKAASLLVQATGAGSYCLGWALTACAGAAQQHNIFVHPMGVLPTTAA